MIKKILFFLFIAFTLITKAQQFKNCRTLIYNQANHPKISQKVDSLLSLCNSQETKALHMRIPKWFFNNKELNLAIYYGKIAEVYFNEKHPEEVKVRLFNLQNLGSYYFRLKKYNQAIDYNFKALELDETHEEAAELYSNIALSYYNLGDLHKSLKYYQLADALLISNKKYNLYVKNANTIGSIYRRLETKESFIKGINQLKLATAITDSIEIAPMYVYNLNLIIGHLNNEPETYNFETAIHHFNKSLALAQEYNDRQLTSVAHIAIANLYLKSDFKQSIEHLHIALNSAQDNIRQQIEIYNNLGYCYLYQERRPYYTIALNESNINKAISYYKKAIALAINNKAKNLSFEKIQDLKNATIKTHLLENVKDLAICHKALYLINNDTKHLEKAIALFKHADTIFDSLVAQSYEYQTKMHWRKIANELYRKAIDVSYLSNDLTSYFYFIEKNKAQLLQQDILYYQTKEQLKVSKSLINKETALKLKLFQLEQQNNSDQSTVLKTKRALEKLQDSIKSLSPEHFKKREFITNAENIQKSLNANSCILEYSIFKESGYGLYIDTTSIIPFKLEAIHDLETESKQLLKYISKPFDTKDDHEAYVKLASSIFEAIIPEHISDKLSNKTTVTIIPDSYLISIPFEALINKEGKYVIETHAVGYQFSNSLALSLQTKTSNSPEVNIFAPIHFSDKNLSPLPKSLDEANNIENTIKAAIYTEGNATKQQFLSSLNSASIMHLATHANANDAISPWIAFNDDKIELKELYLIRNNADLVVLSACQTNTGQLAIGEGVMSLSRGFLQTGSKSIISSLWNVDDHSSSRIMSSFYEQLNNKHTKPEALRKAKLSYLENVSLSESSPYYWASIVFIGNEAPVVLPTKFNLLYGVLITLLVIIIIVFILKKKRT